jgi:uncharacterized protein YprB with RNaseH-like and TPR domain
MEKKKIKPKILLWDIEATNLDANFGYILCIGYKFLGDKNVKLIKIRDFKEHKKDPTNDKKVIEKFMEILKEADMIVTHYGSKYDYPFLQSRALFWGLPPIPPITHFDTWRVCKDRLKLTSNKLDVISKILPIPKKNKKKKTEVEGYHWIKGAVGDIKSLKYIEHHCKMDIEVLEQVYLYLRTIVPNHQNLYKHYSEYTEGCCPSCGSDKVIKSGYLYTLVNKKQRYRCNNCGGWFSLTIKKK